MAQSGGRFKRLMLDRKNRTLAQRRADRQGNRVKRSRGDEPYEVLVAPSGDFALWAERSLPGARRITLRAMCSMPWNGETENHGGCNE
jgi:hypothetical protein